jgi:predicted Zn-dependent protease
MGFLAHSNRIIRAFRKIFSQPRRWILPIAILISVLPKTTTLESIHHSHIAIAQVIERSTQGKVHPLPSSLTGWQAPGSKGDYFQDIKPLPLGYLIWSDRPVSVYIGPSHFSNPSQIQDWETGVHQAIADWQPYFPLEITDQPNAPIVIEQVRPQRPSNGRARSAQATPNAYCEGDRLTHRFAIQISPSQTSRYIQAATRHELGHALGLWGHSNNPQDVMYNAQVSNPPPISERDVNTLKRVYEQPTLLGWPSPKYCSASPKAQSDWPS